MKTKLISMQWRGCASVDPRFSAAMLPWTIADIYSREQFSNVSTKIAKCQPRKWHSFHELYAYRIIRFRSLERQFSLFYQIQLDID